MSRPQVRPRACTSAPPSLNFPSLTGANPSFLAKSATGAIASSSSLDRKTTRWPPSTIGSVASVAAIRLLKPFTNLAPVNAFATKAEDGRPSSSSGGTGNEFIASMTVLPFQLGRAFATSRCSPNGTAKMIVSAASASRSDLATTVGPIARACGANASGCRRLATLTSIFLRAKAWAKAWPILPNPTIAYFIMCCRSQVRTKICEAWSHDWRGWRASHGTAPGSDLRHSPIDGEIHAGDVRTFIGGEECDCCRNFLGHASATHWDLRGELCDRLLGLFCGEARRRR